MTQLFGHLMPPLKVYHGCCCGHHHNEKYNDDQHHYPGALGKCCVLAMCRRIGIIGLRIDHAIGVVSKIVSRLMTAIVCATGMGTRWMHMISRIHIQRFLQRDHSI